MKRRCILCVVRSCRPSVTSYGNLATAVESCRNESLRAVSSQFLAKWSVNSRYCLSPQGEFIGCSGMSLELQKQHVSSNAGSSQLPDWTIVADSLLQARISSCCKKENTLKEPRTSAIKANDFIGGNHEDQNEECRHLCQGPGG